MYMYTMAIEQLGHITNLVVNSAFQIVCCCFSSDSMEVLHVALKFLQEMLLICFFCCFHFAYNKRIKTYHYGQYFHFVSQNKAESSG